MKMRIKWYERWYFNIHSKFWCWWKECDGMTGAHADCIFCPAYRPDKDNCDIPEMYDKDI
jgi:hypothetical protein